MADGTSTPPEMIRAVKEIQQKSDAVIARWKDNPQSSKVLDLLKAEGLEEQDLELQMNTDPNFPVDPVYRPFVAAMLIVDPGHGDRKTPLSAANLEDLAKAARFLNGGDGGDTDLLKFAKILDATARTNNATKPSSRPQTQLGQNAGQN